MMRGAAIVGLLAAAACASNALSVGPDSRCPEFRVIQCYGLIECVRDERRGCDVCHCHDPGELPGSEHGPAR